jgi:ribosomal protein S18 acetylase RimI-like enzyme
MRLRKMTAEEFQQFRRRAIDSSADRKVRSGDWPEALASSLAVADTDALLPDGLETDGTLLLAGEADDVGTFGFVWVRLPNPSSLNAWVYYIEVLPAYRRRGLGRELLGRLEERLEPEGCVAIRLNVVAANHAARGLYKSAGFEPDSLTLRKRL